MSKNSLLAHLRLFRIGNVFTAFADIAMGFIFVSAHSTEFVWLPLLVGLLASGFLYTAGMVLNDAFDAKKDAEERSNRPIPSGEISKRRAFVIGWSFLLVGILLAVLMDRLVEQQWGASRSTVIAICLATAIVLYDGVLKRMPIAPLAMGACRFFNVLLGMTSAAAFQEESVVWLDFGKPELMVAAGIGIYIAGVTWFARTEAKLSNRAVLSFALGVMILGISCLALFPRFSSDPSRFSDHLTTFAPLLFSLVGIVVVRRCIDAIIRPEPQQVQQAIRQSILSLIVFDACVCLAVAPTQPYYGMFVLALLGPMILLSRWIPST